MSIIRKMALTLVALLAVLAANELETVASARQTLIKTVQVGGVETTLRYRCVGGSLLQRNGCYEIGTGDYLGSYWTVNPEKAEVLPDALKWILRVEVQ